MFKVYHPNNLTTPVIEALTEVEARSQAHQKFPGQSLVGINDADPNVGCFVGPFPGSISNNNHSILKKIKGIFHHSR